MFKKFLHDETAIIGLKSLGLCSSPKKMTASKQKEQNLQIFPINNKTVYQEKTVDLSFAQQRPKTVNELFGRTLKLNLNK